MVALSILVFMALAVHLCHSQTCTTQCNATLGGARASCLGRASQCINLYCNAPTATWYRTPLVTNFSLGSFLSNVDSTNYRITADSGQTLFSTLYVRSLGLNDNGLPGFQAVQFGGPLTCLYDMYIYEPTNFAGSINGSNGTNLALTGNNNLTFFLDSFDRGFNYNYRLEAMPLDYLIVNGNRMTTTRCTSVTFPTLTCLMTINSVLSTPKCVDTYRMTFSMGYNDGANLLAPVASTRSLNATIFFVYAPQTTVQTQIIYFKTLNDSISLVCSVGCGRPSLYTYTWTLGTNTSSILFTQASTSSMSSQYNFSQFFTLNSTSVTYQILCTVSNGINSTTRSNSQTLFIIQYDNGSTFPGWAIAVIIIGTIAVIGLSVGAVAGGYYAATKLGAAKAASKYLKRGASSFRSKGGDISFSNIGGSMNPNGDSAPNVKISRSNF